MTARPCGIRAKFAAFFCAAGAFVAASPVRAHEAITSGAAADVASDKEHGRWSGSTLSFDQSVTTQTVHLGADYQTYNPTYEWWVAFKPRYFIHEDKTNALSVSLWANLYLELTNSDTTTRLREPLLGPTYLWATYARTLRERQEYKTSVSVSPRAIIPTDKAARDVGQIIGLGAGAAMSQSFPLRTAPSLAFGRANLAISAIYNHPFSRATSGVNGDIQQLRQDVLGQTFLSDQLTGGMLVKNALNFAVSGELQIVPRVQLSLSYVVLNAWTYAPPATCVAAFPSCAPLPEDDPVTYRVATWATASIDYDVMDELSIDLGYYNLAGQIGRDGTRRNPLYSPDARLFLTLVAKLDALQQRFDARRRP